MKTQVFRTLASQIEEDLRRSPDAPVPSLSELTRSRRVSYRTAWKAVQELVKSEVLAQRRGKRLVRGKALGGSADPAPDSAENLFAKIKAGVEDGTYAAGESLPKSRYFALSEHVSLETVARAFQRLSQENLAYKSGKQWIAGPKKRPRDSRASVHPDTVLLILPGLQDWFHIFTTAFTQSYMFPFRNELVAHGIRIQVAIRRPTADAPFGTPAGEEEIAECIESLGERYRGAFIQSVDLSVDALEELIPFLYKHKKPVIHFDSADQGAALTRSTLHVGRNFFRLRFDEGAAIETAVRYLGDWGHTKVGAHGFVREAWATRRLALLRQCAARLYPAMHIVEAEAAEPSWDFISTPYGEGITLPSGQLVLRHETDRKVRDQLIASRRSFVELLREHAPTAIFCPADHVAREQYWVARALGVRVPEDLSMVSFDNIPHSIMYPLSTIDYGFARMGYLAAHIMIGDINVRADRDGVVAGTCSLVNMGSVAAPSADANRFRRLVGATAG